MISRISSRLATLVGGGARRGRGQRRADITRLFRNPPQLRAIRRWVEEHDVDPCRVAIFGVADGAEAVSLLATLLATSPERRLAIDGFDLDERYLEAAVRGRFTAAHLPSPPGDAELAFLRRDDDGGWTLEERWRPCLRFAWSDLTRVDLPRPPASYDLVLGQNLLIHLSPEDRRKALANLVSWTRPGGLLALGGGPLDEIRPLAAEHALEPRLDDAAAIHEAWEVQRRFYDNPCPPYWALEPFDGERPERYCTLFVRPAAAAGSSRGR